MSRNIFVKFIKIGKAIGFYRVPTFLTTLAVMHPKACKILILLRNKYILFQKDLKGKTMNLDRSRISIHNSEKTGHDEVYCSDKSKALSFVWELTKEIFSLTGKYDVESRLQRNHIVITR